MKVHGLNASEVTEARYLGDLIRNDRKNLSNIRDRVRKGMGIAAEIHHLLKTISFGVRYFDIAKVLREARLINCVLTNAEVWYSLEKKEIADLETIDNLYLRKVLAVPVSVSKESLYLELGLTPISVIIKSRRVMYLHYLANLKKGEMLYQVFESQWKYPTKGDWTESVKVDLLDFGLTFTLDQLRCISKNSFKRIVKQSTKAYALKYLLNIKEKHSKMKNLHYTELKMQSYFRDPGIPVAEAQNIFRFRTRSANFKENMKSMYSDFFCPLCEKEPDSQEHSFRCSAVKQKVKIEWQYEDIFQGKIPLGLSKTLMEITKLRKNMNLSSDTEDPRASLDAAE